MRKAKIQRNTNETKIDLEINLDGSGLYKVDTGIAFLDHLLELFTRHGLFDLEVKAQGDIDVDYHHTVEDLGIVLGQVVKQAVGNKAGMNRYGYFILPMDECLVRVALDLSNRAYLVYDIDDNNGRIRDFNLSLLKEFFQAFANEVGANLHIKLEYGQEPHHIAEAVFKCFAKALNMAVQIDPRRGDNLPTTKGAI